MKRILITALCITSLINAADDNKEIELKLGDGLSSRIFKGHTLNTKENAIASFVGIHQTINFTIIRAEYRKDEECVFGTKGGYEEVTLDHRGYRSEYRCDDGYRYYSKYVDSNDPHDQTDPKSIKKALSLCNFYFKIHAQRTLGIENKSVAESKNSKE